MDEEGVGRRREWVGKEDEGWGVGEEEGGG